MQGYNDEKNSEKDDGAAGSAAEKGDGASGIADAGRSRAGNSGSIHDYSCDECGDGRACGGEALVFAGALRRSEHSLRGYGKACGGNHAGACGNLRGKKHISFFPAESPA